MLYWFVLLALVVYFLFHTYKYREDQRYRGALGSFVWPLVLNVPQIVLARGDLLALLDASFAAAKKYNGKDTFLMYVPAATRVITCDPVNVRYLLMKEEGFSNYKRSHKGDTTFMAKAITKLFGSGIFHADDEPWEIQRKVAGPLFKKDSLDNMKKVFLEKSEVVLGLIDKSGGRPIDVQDLFMKYTLDSFGRIGFDVDICSLTNSHLQFPYHFDRAEKNIMDFAVNPLLQYTNTKKEFLDSVKFLDDFFYDKIKSHSTDGNDLMAQFMTLRNEAGELYPRQWIRDILLNFLLAARDTTGQLLTWSTYAIATHPEILKKAREEVIQVLGTEKLPTDADMKKMVYINNIIKETLRVYPSVPQTTRIAEAADTLPDGTKIRAGDRVIYSQYSLHRNPKYWERPNEFSPERWESPTVLKNAFQYVPFHGGPMQCLGRHMAHIEAKILLVLILQRYKDIKLVSASAIVPRLGLTLSAKDGVPLQFVSC